MRILINEPLAVNDPLGVAGPGIPCHIR